MPEVKRAGRRLRDAIELQFKDLPPDERRSRAIQLIQTHENRTVNLDDCLVVFERGRLVSVLLLVRQSDGTIYVWPAASASGVPCEQTAQNHRQLYAEAAAVVDRRGWIGQTLLSVDETVQSADLAANGFPRLTDLLFMNRPLDDPIPVQDELPGWSVQSYDEQTNATLFSETIERTYIGTMDCPELNGCRTGIESLAGHRLAGTFSADCWHIFSIDDEPVGLLLRTEHPEEQVQEVVYFGIVPERRGQGFGRRLILEGLTRAAGSGAHELVLAVDVRNTPALGLYESLGFQKFDRRTVHARLPGRLK
jgi:ribosomal protein S18 acetylase RimI-like enzyme